MRPYIGKRVDNGEWVYGDCHKEFSESSRYTTIGVYISYISANGIYKEYEVIPETVGQSTGLKDKSGKELDWWKGDLLRKGAAHPYAPIGIIIYDEQSAKWVIVSKSGGEFCVLVEAYKNGWKKVGNIHDDHELLENT